MKHAMVLTAYNDFEILELLLKYYSLCFECYVHVDKKSKIPENTLNELKKLPNVYLYQKYKVNWGSYRHICAVMYLLERAKETKNYDFYHILPANAFPVKSFKEIDSFFEKINGKNYIEMIPVAGNMHLEERQRYYYFLHLYDLKKPIGRKIEKYITKIQKELHIKRRIIYDWKGYFYCHLTNEFVCFCIKEWKNHIHNLKKMWCPEEFFFQNLVINSPFRDTVMNNHLIYSEWISNRGGDTGMFR